jgi:hypothetical protein
MGYLYVRMYVLNDEIQQYELYKETNELIKHTKKKYALKLSIEKPDLKLSTEKPDLKLSTEKPDIVNILGGYNFQHPNEIHISSTGVCKIIAHGATVA